jgi:hypothetical protein
MTSEQLEILKHLARRLLEEKNPKLFDDLALQMKVMLDRIDKGAPNKSR